MQLENQELAGSTAGPTVGFPEEEYGTDRKTGVGIKHQARARSR